jgi:hypothetical protein
MLWAMLRLLTGGQRLSRHTCHTTPGCCFYHTATCLKQGPAESADHVSNTTLSNPATASMPKVTEATSLLATAVSHAVKMPTTPIWVPCSQCGGAKRVLWCQQQQDESTESVIVGVIVLFIIVIILILQSHINDRVVSGARRADTSAGRLPSHSHLLWAWSQQHTTGLPG